MGDTSPKGVIKAFFDLLGKGDLAGATAFMSPDVTYILQGTTPLSGTHKGLEAAGANVFGPLGELLVEPIVLTLRELIAEGDRVVARATGKALAKHGRYDNVYCFVFTVTGGKITSMEEYLDSALVETAIYGRKLA